LIQANRYIEIGMKKPLREGLGGGGLLDLGGLDGGGVGHG